MIAGCRSSDRSLGHGSFSECRPEGDHACRARLIERGWAARRSSPSPKLWIRMPAAQREWPGADRQDRHGART